MGERDDEAEGILEKAKIPLLKDQNVAEEENGEIKKEIWLETKKLWRIVGPAIFTRVTTNLIFVITQAFAGHLGELELAAISIVNNVIIGFNYSLFVYIRKQYFLCSLYYNVGFNLLRNYICLYADWNGDCVGNVVRSSVWSKEV